LDDFSIIFLNHFQLLGITVPGQTAHQHKTNAEINKVRTYKKITLYFCIFINTIILIKSNI